MAKINSIKIVVAEDDEDDKSFIIDAFKNLNLIDSVKFVENGEELIKYLKKTERYPDIIFLDLNMPILNGIQSLKIIKNDIDFKKIPIIILTTSKDQEDIDKTYGSGISAYIVKPFSFEDLLMVVRETTNYYFNTVTLPYRYEE